jgi:preprotein translocase subunit Sec63
MAHDARQIAEAYRVLGLAPGVSPLAARRRYRALIREVHPDRYPHGSTSQAEATRRTQKINEAYYTLKHAAVHREVPLRQPAAAAQPATSSFTPLRVDTISDRVGSGIVGVVVGLFLAFALSSESAIVWVVVPLATAGVSAAVGWRAIEAVIRFLWWAS